MKNIIKIIIVFFLTLQFCNVINAQTNDTTSYQNYVNTNIVTNGTRSITASHLNYSLLSSMAISQKFRREFMDSVRAHRLRDFYNITANKISDWNTVFNWYNSNPLSSYALTNGSNASGTWGINISGNASTASNATNTTQWNYVTYNGSVYSSGTPTYVMAWDGANYRPVTQTPLRDFLGLGSYAYRSTGLAELNAPNTGYLTASYFINDGSALYSYYLKGRASDNYGVFGFYSNNGAIRYGYIQSHSSYGGQVIISSDGGASISLDNRGMSVNGVFTSNSDLLATTKIRGFPGSSFGGTLANGEYQFYGGSGLGLVIAGSGTTNSITFTNGSGSVLGGFTSSGTLSANNFSGSASGLTGTASSLTAGRVTTNLISPSSNTTLTTDHDVIRPTANCTLTLPDATTCGGKTFQIFTRSAINVTVNTVSSQKMYLFETTGSETITIGNFSVLVLVSDGVGWISQAFYSGL